MTTFFKTETTTFESNDNYTYFYATWTENGKQIKKRIKKAEYEQALREFEAETAAKMHENLDKLCEKVDESEITEEVKEIAKELAPKAKKARKSKDIAWAGDGINAPHTVTLTAKQVDFIKHLPDTYFWENGVESIIWVDCLCDDIQGQFANKPMTVGAMISTLCEKGLGTRATNRKGPRGGKATSFALTEMGQAVAIDLGLE